MASVIIPTSRWGNRIFSRMERIYTSQRKRFDIHPTLYRYERRNLTWQQVHILMSDRLILGLTLKLPGVNFANKKTAKKPVWFGSCKNEFDGFDWPFWEIRADVISCEDYWTNGEDWLRFFPNKLRSVLMADGKLIYTLVFAQSSIGERKDLIEEVWCASILEIGRLSIWVFPRRMVNFWKEQEHGDGFKVKALFRGYSERTAFLAFGLLLQKLLGLTVWVLMLSKRSMRQVSLTTIPTWMDAWLGQIGSDLFGPVFQKQRKNWKVSEKLSDSARKCPSWQSRKFNLPGNIAWGQ